MPLTPQLLNKLNHAIVTRSVSQGLELLRRASKDLEKLTPADTQAAAYLVCLAQWVDVGYQNLEYLNELIRPFMEMPRAEMPFSDYIRLRLAEAYRAFLSEDMAGAASILNFVAQIEPEIVEPQLMVLAHYWKGRVHRRQGEYEPALHHIQEAKRLAQRMGAPRLAAVASIHEGWLLFQRGQRRDALRLLNEAEAELKSTGHALSLGNIESARGRFVRRSGEYTKALGHFERAVQIYGEQFGEHPNMARALVNSAYVKRLIALDLLQRYRSGRAKAAEHVRYLEICHEALDLLRRASDIYSRLHHQAGTGSVLVNAGHLHLDTGDFGRAEDEAKKAFSLAEEKQDHILMARSRILQATIQNERSEEEGGESPNIAAYAHLALSYAEDAIAWARLTQNNHLLAGAYVIRGSIATNDFFQDWEAAKHFAALAGERLGKDDLDHLSKQLSSLKRRILKATGIDEMLRSWSEGIVGDKSFQQVTEEFAELVIPKVWIREGRKIARVSEVLSISPKKVRRILKSVNMLKP